MKHVTTKCVRLARVVFRLDILCVAPFNVVALYIHKKNDENKLSNNTKEDAKEIHVGIRSRHLNLLATAAAIALSFLFELSRCAASRVSVCVCVCEVWSTYLASTAAIVQRNQTQVICIPLPLWVVSYAHGHCLWRCQHPAYRKSR